jgi:diguanylate cyclase (GGDEF)-like protein
MNSKLAAQIPGEGARQLPSAWRHLLPYVVVTLSASAITATAYARPDARVVSAIYILGGLVIEFGVIHQVLAYRALKAHAHRSARLENLADADPVTSLPNHRALVSLIEHEIGPSEPYQHPCSLLFLDLDHFKALNDTFGHHAGDKALHEFGAVVRAALRTTDTLGRWGGEEFVAILPGTDGEAALAVAERIRATVAEHTFWAVGGGHLTCSVGLASYPRDALHRDALVELADQAMYAAKRLGRNQVRLAPRYPAGPVDDQARGQSPRDEAAQMGVVDALCSLVGARDATTVLHGKAVAELAVRIAQRLNRDATETHVVRLAAELHDSGKVAVPDAILRKPGPLTVEEWEVIRRHPVVGGDIVARVPSLRMLAPIVRAHHERWDGMGYPDGLKGMDIPFAARILTVADAYVAMTTDRPYQRARSDTEAADELRRCSGSQFDPAVVEALLQILGDESSQSEVA